MSSGRRRSRRGRPRRSRRRGEFQARVRIGPVIPPAWSNNTPQRPPLPAECAIPAPGFNWPCDADVDPRARALLAGFLGSRPQACGAATAWKMRATSPLPPNKIRAASTVRRTPSSSTTCRPQRPGAAAPGAPCKTLQGSSSRRRAVAAQTIPRKRGAMSTKVSSSTSSSRHSEGRVGPGGPQDRTPLRRDRRRAPTAARAEPALPRRCAACEATSRSDAQAHSRLSARRPDS